MRTECPINMKQTALEREFHISFHFMPQKTNFDLCPVYSRAQFRRGFAYKRLT